MSNTINNVIPFVPENTIDPAAGLNLALNSIDALLQLAVVTVGANTPPAGVEGNRYIVGTSPTGAWAGQANKIARYLDGAWSFYAARYALNISDGLWYVRTSTTWSALAGGSGMTNPMAAIGDLIVGGVAGAPARLPVGSEGQTPIVRSGVLVYETPAVSGAVTFAPVAAETTTARTSVIGDAGKFITFDNAGASTYTIAPQASVAWSADTEISVYRNAAGNLTLTPGAGVTLKPPSGGTLVLTNAMTVTLKRLASNTWAVIGQTVAV